MAAVLVLPLALFSEVILLNDTFDDNDRTNQDLPGSAAWFYSHSDAISLQELTPAGNYAMVQDLDSTVLRAAHAYFTGVGSEADISADPDYNIIQYRMDVTLLSGDPASSSSHGVRLLTANSGAERLEADTYTSVDVTQGYGFKMDPDSGKLWLLRRAGTGQLGSQSTSVWANLTGGEDNWYAGGLTVGETYTFGLDIELLGNGDVELTVSLFDGENTTTFTHVDDTYQVTEFDTVVLSGFRTYGDMAFDNVQVGLIPEPATIGMLGLGALLALWIRRMKA